MLWRDEGVRRHEARRQPAGGSGGGGGACVLVRPRTGGSDGVCGPAMGGRAPGRTGGQAQDRRAGTRTGSGAGAGAALWHERAVAPHEARRRTAAAAERRRVRPSDGRAGTWTGSGAGAGAALWREPSRPQARGKAAAGLGGGVGGRGTRVLVRPRTGGSAGPGRVAVVAAVQWHAACGAAQNGRAHGWHWVRCARTSVGTCGHHSMGARGGGGVHRHPDGFGTGGGTWVGTGEGWGPAWSLLACVVGMMHWIPNRKSHAQRLGGTRWHSVSLGGTRCQPTTPGMCMVCVMDGRRQGRKRIKRDGERGSSKVQG